MLTPFFIDFFGTSRNDVITRIQNFGRIFGGHGNDRLTLVATSEDGDAYGECDGGLGNDRISLSISASAVGALANAVAAGGDGNDAISASVSSLAGSAAGSFDGGSGNDVIKARIDAAEEAAGSILGGAGNDLLSLTLASVSGSVLGSLSGGEGNDALSLTMTSGASGSVVGEVDGGGGNDAISVFVSSDDSEGGTATDVVLTATGGDGNDLIQVGIEGLGAEDAAAVSVWGGNGNDSVSVALPVGPFAAAIGANLFGEAGNDLLSVTGGGLSLLSGGAGNDVLRGSAVAQLVLEGGAGADCFVSDYGNPEGPSRQIDIVDFHPDTTLTFDDLVVDPALAQIAIADGYGGFDWDGAVASDVAQFETIEPGNGGRAVSPSNVVVNAAPSVTITRADDFDLISGWFSALYKDDLRVTADAYDDGALILSTDIIVKFGTATKYTFGFASIDTVVFTVDTGSGLVVLDNAPESNDVFGFDNLTFRLDGDEGDLIELQGATESEIEGLLATAAQVGSNAVLALPDGVLTLQNFSAADLLPDMFVV